MRQSIEMDSYCRFYSLSLVLSLHLPPHFVTHRYTAARLLRALLFMFKIKPNSLKEVKWSTLQNIMADTSRTKGSYSKDGTEITPPNPMGLFKGCSIPPYTSVQDVVDCLLDGLGKVRKKYIMRDMEIQHITMWLCFLANFEEAPKKK